MPDRPTIEALLAAVEGYFNLMYDNDVARFDQVFASSAQLHGLRAGNKRRSPSPKAKSAPRHQQILLVDFASAAQAVVKVRVRIDTVQYLDYLSYHCIDGLWLITAKSFHIERRYDAPAA